MALAKDKIEFTFSLCCWGEYIPWVHMGKATETQSGRNLELLGNYKIIF